MEKGVCFTGIPSAEELAKAPGVPARSEMNKGPVAVIECVQEIPCNPCEAACPSGAITVGSDITKLPVLDAEKCIGCGNCLAHCPGLAITLVNVNYSETEAAVSFPFEYLPLPKVGDEVNAVNRGGEAVCKGNVLSVRMPQSYKQTCIVTIAIPKKYVEDVRSMELPIKRALPEPAAKKEIDKSSLICRCEELTQADIEKAIEEGATTLDGVKKHSRAGMGLCQGKSCERLVARIIAEKTGQKVENLLPATHRPPVRPIRLKVVDDDADIE